MYEVHLLDTNEKFLYKSRLLALLDAGYLSSQGYAVEVIQATSKTLIRRYNTR
jgi:hypothetical protein